MELTKHGVRMNTFDEDNNVQNSNQLRVEMRKRLEDRLYKDLEFGTGGREVLLAMVLTE